MGRVRKLARWNCSPKSASLASGLCGVRGHRAQGVGAPCPGKGLVLWHSGMTDDTLPAPFPGRGGSGTRSLASTLFLIYKTGWLSET